MSAENPGFDEWFIARFSDAAEGGRVITQNDLRDAFEAGYEVGYYQHGEDLL